MSEEITITENRYNTAIITLWLEFVSTIITFGFISILTDEILRSVLLLLAFSLLIGMFAKSNRGYCHQLLNYLGFGIDWVMMDVDRDELAREGTVTIHK